MTKSKNDKRCILCNKPYDYKYEMFGRDRKYIKQGNKFSVFLFSTRYKTELLSILLSVAF